MVMFALSIRSLIILVQCHPMHIAQSVRAHRSLSSLSASAGFALPHTSNPQVAFLRAASSDGVNGLAAAAGPSRIRSLPAG